MARGMLIALEGIDGTGKGTQARLLARALRRSGHRVDLFSFPAYGRTAASSLIAAYLNGKLGSLDPRLTALLFACDRLEVAPRLRASLAAGHMAVCDRYVPSNLAHQVARARPSERSALRRWIERLEYDYFGLPRPDATVLLEMAPALARRRVLSKGHRAYTRRVLDVQEASPSHLALALAEYRRQARGRGWIRVFSVDHHGQPLTRPEVHAAVRAALARFRGLFRPRRRHLPARGVRSPARRR